MNTSFYAKDELKKIGLKKIGENVLISRNACFYGGEDIVIGNNTRIDDFCILSGHITIGDNVHIAAYSALFSGKYEIKIGDFTAISSRCSMYAESDDYTGISLSGAIRDERFRQPIGGNIILEKHVLVGTGCTILPEVQIGEGVSVGAMSLINHNLLPWSVYVGIPARKIGERNKDILRLEEQYRMIYSLKGEQN